MNTVPHHTAPTIYMAPLKGITDALFRRVFTTHFCGIDIAVAPFINPQQNPRYPDKLVADLLPEHRCGIRLIPQILNTDVEGFISLGNRLYDLGYDEINWNLGCPVKMVAGKRRGSGLLPYPETIVELLERILPHLKPALSIKMRLGYRDHRESLALLPRLDGYPLASITVHARLGTQLYRGSVDLDHFQACRIATRHTMVYNGDLVSLDSFTRLAGRFDTVAHWMIGRGLLMNPFLPAQIKGYRIPDGERDERLHRFHDDLYRQLKVKLAGPGHLLGRMKQVWIYFSHAFPGREKQVKRIIRSTTETTYLKGVDALFSR